MHMVGHVSENHCPCKFLAYRRALIIILALTEENAGITNRYCGATTPVVLSQNNVGDVCWFFF